MEVLQQLRYAVFLRWVPVGLVQCAGLRSLAPPLLQALLVLAPSESKPVNSFMR